MSKIHNVLILCTGNSARSILGEALINHLPTARGKLRGYSAGSQPKTEPNPHALAWLREAGIATEGLRSKSWDEFALPDAPRMDYIFTVCDSAAGEACPYWPGAPLTAHWGMPDPAAVEGSDADKRRAFAETAAVLTRRIEAFAALPLHTLSRDEVLAHAREIGRG